MRCRRQRRGRIDRRPNQRILVGVGDDHQPVQALADLIHRGVMVGVVPIESCPQPDSELVQVCRPAQRDRTARIRHRLVLREWLSVGVVAQLDAVPMNARLAGERNRRRSAWGHRELVPQPNDHRVALRQLEQRAGDGPIEGLRVSEQRHRRGTGLDTDVDRRVGNGELRLQDVSHRRGQRRDGVRIAQNGARGHGHTLTEDCEIEGGDR